MIADKKALKQARREAQAQQAADAELAKKRAADEDRETQLRRWLTQRSCVLALPQVHCYGRQQHEHELQQLWERQDKVGA